MLEKVEVMGLVERRMRIVIIRCRYDAKTSSIRFIKKNDDKIRKTNVIPVNTDRSGFIVANH
jgi:hypothetical protein